MKISSRVLCYTLGLLTLGLLISLPPKLAHSAEAARAQTSVLVNPDWVQQQLSQPNVRVLEVGQRDSYETGHLPSAQFVDWIVDITDARVPDRYNILPRAQFEQLMSRLGVTRDTLIVLYDKFESRLSTRMFWTLRYYGHERVKLLDGGAKAWVDSGRSFSLQEPLFARTEYEASKVDSSLEADQKFIHDRVGSRRIQLIDGRPPGQFTGEEPGKVYHTGKAHNRRGHLPQAISIHWQENLTSEGRFKSVNELRKIYTSRLPSNESPIVTYCNEGLHAAHPWFVLTELLGYDDVRLYDDSLSEWANSRDTPLVVSRETEIDKR